MGFKFNPFTTKPDYFENPTASHFTIGIGAVGIDYRLTFDGETTDGIITWMEDEDYFLFSDAMFMFDAQPIYFRSNQSYIYSEGPGAITLVGVTNVDLVTNAVIIGKNIDEDISITFNAASADGIVTWMEDEDYFKFSDDVMIPAAENIFLVDTGTYLRHDGTNLVIADDAKINLFSNAVTFGTTVDSDITVAFQANSNSGVFYWMEDEDWFAFPDHVRMTDSGICYKDINLGFAQLGQPAAGAPSEEKFVDEAAGDTGIYTLAFAVNEYVSGSFELQHYAEGTNLTFHIHWQGSGAPTGTDYVKWQLSYTVARDETTLDAVTTIVVETAYDTQYEFKRSDFPAITGTNFKIGDQLLFKLMRIAAAGDAYAGDAYLATCGVHYQVNSLGSRGIGTK